MFERPYLKLVKSKIEESKKFIQVISVPRQVGETTPKERLKSEV